MRVPAEVTARQPVDPEAVAVPRVREPEPVFYNYYYYTKYILCGWPQRQQETLYPYTRGLLYG